MTEQKPTVGRIVHYHSYGTPGGEYLPEARAAIITEVVTNSDSYPDRTALAVINPTGLFFREDVPYSPTPKPGHWTWPPREPAPAVDLEGASITIDGANMERVAEAVVQKTRRHGIR